MLLQIVFNTWAKTAQAKFNLPLNLFENFGDRACVLFAIPVCSILLSATSYLGLRYAKRTSASCWNTAIPKAFNVEFNSYSIEGKAYQAIFLVLFVIFPLGGLIRFHHVMFTTIVTDWNGAGNYSLFTWDPGNVFNGLAYKFDGVSFYPFWEPFLWLILSCTAGIFSAQYLCRIFFR